MSVTILFDTDAAVEFLTSFSPPPWTVIAIQPTKAKGENAHVRAKSFVSKQAAHEWIESYNGKWNLYFTPNRADPKCTTSPQKDEITHVRCLHLDLDLPKNAEHTQENYDALLAKIESLEPAPHKIVFSGGGYQCFWLFPEELSAKEYGERVEAANQAIAQQIGGDNCHNLNRLMRLPGTVNMLNAAKIARGREPALTYLARANDNLPLWSFAQSVLPGLPFAAAPEDQINESEKSPEPGTSTEFSVETLGRRLKAAIKKGDPAEWNGDRSKMVWYICCALVRLGVPDEKIKDVVLNREYGCSGHVYDQSNPEKYAEAQVRKAKTEVANDWQRTKDGMILARSQANIKKAANRLGARFGHNEFEDRYYVNGSGPLRVLDDGEINNLWLKVDTEFGFLPERDLFFSVISDVAKENRFNPPLNYVNRLEWDGVPRLDTWLARLAAAEDTPYTRAVGALTLIAGVRRLRYPGCKKDEMLVFVCPIQGTNKSTALAILAKNQDWFTDSFPLNARDKAVIEALNGKWIVEVAELSGMKQAEVEEVKSMLSRQVDRARLAYARMPVERPRRCIFFGTTNSTEFLRDTQNRRFWPVTVGEIDIEGLRAEVDQLWAEAAYRESQGESHFLPRDLWEAAAEVQRQHKIEDAWTVAIQQALGSEVGHITGDEVWKIIGRGLPNRMPSDSARLGDCMRDLGWQRKQFRYPGVPKPVWAYYNGPGPALYVTVDEIGQTAYVGPSPESSEVEAMRDVENRHNSANIQPDTDATPVPF